MFTVGLTGNIGSGKTFLSRIFEVSGAAVFNADAQARHILKEDAQQKILIKQFGNQILGADLIIDRQKLAQLIFNNKQALDFVNHLIHPLVRQRFDSFCKSNIGATYCIYEAAILIETGFYKKLDKIIMITAPEECRIQRVMQRDNISRELVMQRMQNQQDEASKIGYADFIIVNHNTAPILLQCLEIHQELAILAANSPKPAE